jgi:16S rRNA (guanine1516-N2)-methyltransferase
MALKVIKEGREISTDSCQFFELNKFCSDQGTSLQFEWHKGQYWLHSDRPKELPVGIEVDAILRRHEDFFKKSSIQKELLARAVGIKGAHRPKVLDLTGGLLGDALLLLSFGCEVLAVERHPVIRFLIQSALENATHPKLEKFQFLNGDALSVLEGQREVQVAFFDPMFEDANKKASPRKEMRIFRDLVGKDADAVEVFHKAHEMSLKRLVVKRPRHSVFLGPKPNVEYIGKSTRYDVYFSL